MTRRRQAGPDPAGLLGGIRDHDRIQLRSIFPAESMSLILPITTSTFDCRRGNRNISASALCSVIDTLPILKTPVSILLLNRPALPGRVGFVSTWSKRGHLARRTDSTYCRATQNKLHCSLLLVEDFVQHPNRHERGAVHQPARPPILSQRGVFPRVQPASYLTGTAETLIGSIPVEPISRPYTGISDVMAIPPTVHEPGTAGKVHLL